MASTGKGNSSKSRAGGGRATKVSGQSPSAAGVAAAAEAGAAASAPAATRRRRSSKDDDPGTRQKVIEAAIRCILEQGFYRASSNAIAETAGLSWGVIQYYFGSRESLMLAVLEEGNQRLIRGLGAASITGGTMIERLEQYFEILEEHYGHPEYLAFIQVLLNLSHDPRTSEKTLEAMTNSAAEINEQINRLTNQLFAGTKIRQRALRTFPFYALRGLAISGVMLGTLPYDTTDLKKNVANQPKLLEQAVAMLLEAEVASGKPGG